MKTVLPVLLLVVTVTAQELLKNPGFESLSNWKCINIHCSLTNDRHSGNHAIQTSGRHMYYQGPSQDVHVVKDEHIYNVEAWVKVLNDNGKSQRLQIEVSHHLKNGHVSYLRLAGKSPITTHDGWVHLAGQFVAPTNVDFTKVYFQGPDPEINFAVDAASMNELHFSQENWQHEANTRIDKLRKNNIHFQVTTAGGVSADTVTLEVSQTKHSFPFGTEVAAKIMNNNHGGSDHKYRQFVYDHYNWAVPGNALKWNHMETSRGHPNYMEGETAVRILRQHGLKVRAHNLLWATDKRVPAWLKPLPNSEIEAEINKHVHDTITRYKGLVEHWDVNNELLHGRWYEDKLHDPNYTKKIFRLVHHYDPNVTLFLNEYDVVAGGGTTQRYLAQGKDFKASNTYIGGMGVQCHFPDSPVPALIKQRLDELSHAGIPLWATEFDVQNDDEHKRADWYETAYRMLFSHPSIHGILTWGFWSEHHWRGEAGSLVSGPEFRINAAGNRFLHLINEEWRTKYDYHLSKGNAFTVRGFHGDYEVKVKVNGSIVQTQHFTLGKSDHTINIHVSANHRI